jgi:hypothetical protein
MKKLILLITFITLFFTCSLLNAQVPPPFILGAGLPTCSTNGYVLTYSTTTHKYACAVVSGTAANPGGTANQIQYNSGGTAFAGFTMSGDCTLVVASGAITCAKSGGVSFGTGAFATIASYATLANPTFTGTVGGITSTMVGLSAVTNDAQTKASVVPNTAPASGQILVGNTGGTAYAPITMSGDAAIAFGGGVTVSKYGGGTTILSAASHASTDFALSSTTVNGHALSSNVTVSASDLTTGTLPHAQLPALVSGDIPNLTAGATYLMNLSAASPATGLRYGFELPAWVDNVPSAGYPITYDHAAKAIKFYDSGWNSVGATAAPVDASYITLGTDGTLTSERVLTMGTSMAAGTDGGANSTYTINPIQDIRTTATPQFARLGLGLAADGTQFLKIGTGADFATISSIGVLAFGGAGAITGYQTTITRPVTGPSTPLANSLVKFTGTGQATDNAGAILGTMTDGYYCKYTTSGTLISCNTQFTTASDLVFTSDAAGDMAYRGASSYGRLAKGAAYNVLRMNAGDTAPQWSTFTINDATTNALTISNGTGSLIAGAAGSLTIGAGKTLILNGTFTDGDLCNYTASGTLIGCNVNPSTYQTSDGTLTALAGLTITSGSLIYGTGTDAFSVLAAGSTGKMLQMGATNPAWSSATWPTAATTGKLIRANGTNYLETTLTMPDTIAAGSIFAANSANVLSAITSATGTYYLANTSGTISWAAPAGTGDLKADGTIPLTADWNVGAYVITAKGFASAKTSGTAGTSQLYNDSSTQAFGVIFEGPTGSMASAYTLQYPNATPTTGQVVAYGTPMTWVVPALSSSYANQISINTMTNGGLPYVSSSNTISSTAALTTHGIVVMEGASTAPVVVANVANPTYPLFANSTADPSFRAIAASDLPIVTGSKGGTGIANNDLNTITFAGGNYSMAWTLGGNTSVTFPTSGTLGTLTAPIALASQAVGDIFYATSGTAITRLADVAAGQPLLSGGVTTAPGYAGYTFSGTAAQTYTFPSTTSSLLATTGSPAAMVIASQATGDLLYASSANAWTRLAAGTDSYVLTISPSTHVPIWSVAGGFTGGTLTTALTLKVGAIGVGAGPLYFQSGTNLTTAAAGAMEFDGTSFYLSPSTTRYSIPLAGATAPLTFTTGGATARIITFPDAAITVARTDAANSFTGVQTMTSPALTTAAITTDIHAATAGTGTIGTAAAPFASFYLGNAATNNFQITGTSAAARIVNIPDIAVTGYIPLLTATDTAAGKFPTSTTVAGKYTDSTSTYADTYVQGGLLHAATANTIAALAPGAVGSFLMSNGSGAALSYLAAGSANYQLVGAGVTTIPVWTASTGTGSPVMSTSPVLTTASVTPQAIDCSANCTPTAAQLSNAIVGNYGQSPTSSGVVTVTAPALVAGINFVMIQGTALTSTGGFRLDAGASSLYLDGSSTAQRYATFTAQPISSSLSCFSFKTNTSTWLLKCTTLSGTSAGS